jgi:transcriptional regulator with XRE-family HTH domain
MEATIEPENTIVLSIGQRIKTERKKLKQNQKQFAVVLGTDQTMLSRIENQQARPSLALIKKFKEATNLSYDEIMEGVSGE